MNTSSNKTSSTSNQNVNGRTVTIMRDMKTGFRFARIIDNGRESMMPVELLPLCSGSDLWMREILVRCEYCRKPTRAADMENGVSCRVCFDEAGEENAELDGAKR